MRLVIQVLSGQRLFNVGFRRDNKRMLRKGLPPLLRDISVRPPPLAIPPIRLTAHGLVAERVEVVWIVAQHDELEVFDRVERRLVSVRVFREALVGAQVRRDAQDQEGSVLTVGSPVRDCGEVTEGHQAPDQQKGRPVVAR